ncbi:MAG: GNAT family N-acetyltransferase [Acidobacteriia bacterium]|nr:GNAT family N-acetyltransferase [Terriglobia bacterium]
MAARLHPSPLRAPEIVDLRRLSARDLESLLIEETAAWQTDMEWDFEKSADLVRRFVDLRALNGGALIEDGLVAGYLYYVLEDNKGLVGDLYVRRDLRTPEREARLLEWGLHSVMGCPPINRIESQLMMLRFSPDRQIPRSDCLRTFERNFMRVDLRRTVLSEGRVRRPIYTERWSDHYQDAAAHLIAAAYAGHIDSSINDQYRTAAGARKFLYNIVQYPGCGSFFRPASFAAFEAATGHMCGISLASLVAPECGHITQICVSPSVRGTGIGHALLHHSLTTLRDMGCRSVSLTVTAANEDAVKLYERVGFHTVRRFSAYVWEGW